MKIKNFHEELFPKFEPATEKAFLLQYLNKALFRTGIIFGWIIMGAFAYLDQYYFPETLHTAWLFRFGVILPCMFTIYLLSFLKVFKRIYVPIAMASLLIVAYGLIAIIYCSHDTELGNHHYYSGLMIIVLYIGFFSELRILQAFFTIAVIILGYLWVAIFKHNMLTGMFENPNFPLLLGNTFFLMSSGILSLIGTFLFERYRRFSFMQIQIIAREKEIVDKQNHFVEEKNKEIIDSINYAQKIQSAIIPPEAHITELLHENFIFYKPRDIVSGDFYWVKQVNHHIVLVAADCTGHGVPGAFMSMLGISFLNEIVQRREITQANQILNELRKQIKHSLRQHGKREECKDGMDIALCVIDIKNNMMQYAGAFNPLYLIRDVNGKPELQEVKADRMPVGFHYAKDKSFTNHEIQLEIGDTFYIFSDGFIDQIGGKEEKKYLSRRFKELLLEIHEQPMYEQKEILDKTLKNWMEGYCQIDDILVVGVRV